MISYGYDTETKQESLQSLQKAYGTRNSNKRLLGRISKVATMLRLECASKEITGEIITDPRS